jgi:hypothetical protein
MVARLVAGIVAGDDQEAADLRTTLAWPRPRTSTAGRKPATPDRHLVSSVAPLEPATGRVG